MIIELKESLNINVAELAKYLPEFVHEKQYGEQYYVGYFTKIVISESIRDDIIIPGSFSVLDFYKKTELGFNEIKTDYTEDELSSLLTRFPLSIQNKLFDAFDKAGVKLSRTSSLEISTLRIKRFLDSLKYLGEQEIIKKLQNLLKQHKNSADILSFLKINIPDKRNNYSGCILFFALIKNYNASHL